jgi:hypothetical protein
MSNSMNDLQLSTAVHMLDLTAISESRLLRNSLIPRNFSYLEQFTQTSSSYASYTMSDFLLITEISKHVCCLLFV